MPSAAYVKIPQHSPDALEVGAEYSPASREEALGPDDLPHNEDGGTGSHEEQQIVHHAFEHVWMDPFIEDK